MLQILTTRKLTAREFLQKFLCVKNESAYRFFKRPIVWQWNKQTIAKSVLIGIVIAFLPLPFQMIVAALASVYFGAYLPLSVALVWLSNPITFLPITWACLSIGCNILQMDMSIASEIKNGQYWLLLKTYWMALMLGSLVSGLTLGLIGYYITHWAWRFISTIPKTPAGMVSLSLSENDKHSP